MRDRSAPRQAAEGAPWMLAADPYVYLFPHIPKTGGSTLHHWISSQLRLNIDCFPVYRDDSAYRAGTGLPPFAERSPADRAKARFIFGHAVNSRTHELVPDKEPRYLIILRDPAERAVSQYNYAMNKRQGRGQPTVPFDEWFENKDRQYSRSPPITQRIVKAFLGNTTTGMSAADKFELAMKALEDFWFVSITERLDDEAPLVLKGMGLAAPRQGLPRKKVAGVDLPAVLRISDTIRARVYDALPLELEFYTRWKDRAPKMDDPAAGS